MNDDESMVSNEQSSPPPDPLSTEQRLIVNKRLTLNLLIQGSATHAYWAAHHLVADELNQLNPILLPTYEHMMLRARLGYWVGGIPMIMGSPIKFWKRIVETGHEFGFHPFFVRHGYDLAQRTRKDVKRRCKEAELSTNGVQNEVESTKLYFEIIEVEAPHLNELENLAKKVCCEVYGIDESLLYGQLTSQPRFGAIREPTTDEGRMILQCMAGWSAVVRKDGKLTVKAKATFWPLLIHELVKGTVELICLHGMSDFDDDQFKVAMDHTEFIEFEVPMLQIGGTFFQKFLAALPRKIPLAECIMHTAKLDPLELEKFAFYLIESPNRATDMIRIAAEGN